MVKARPKRAAVSKRQSTNTLLANVPRRTPAEVQKAKADAAAAAAQVAATKVQKKNEIADLEDRLRKEDVARDKVATRPDLQKPKSVKNKVLLFLISRTDKNKTFNDSKLVFAMTQP
jgi:hypothetical protein